MSRRPQPRVCLGHVTGHPEFKGFSLSLSPPTDAEAKRIFSALGGGQLLLPMARTFYAPSFGMVADRFGVSWRVMVAPAPT